MKTFKRSACVFCGAQNGRATHFRETAYAVGQLLAKYDFRLVYGGSKDGLMGAIADGVLSKDGCVVGVLPKKLANKELAHPDIHTLHVVDTMAERKDILMNESDLFLILPGGLGTLDELFEVLTANSLGFMSKPVIILNTEGYYSQLIQWLSSIADTGLSKKPGDLFSVINDLDSLEQLLS